jgi:hypothetical protein
METEVRLEQTMKAQRRSNYTYTLSLTSVLDGEGGQRHVPAALPLARGPGRSVQEDARAPGSVWTGAEYLASPHHQNSIPGPSIL